MNTMNLLRNFAVIFGTVMVTYIGLYYCGWEAIVDLIDYARCDWKCADTNEIAWGVFRLMPLLEFFVGIGTWIFIFGVVRP